MTILLDTHIVIWLATQPEFVPNSLQTKIADTSQRLISSVSFAEVAFKRHKFGDRFPFTVHDMQQALVDLKAIELPLTSAHLGALTTLPVLHKDPFDHLLMSQALTIGAELASLDTDVQKYESTGLRLAF